MQSVLQTEEVARRLRDAVASGRLRPGDPIRQNAIAAELGVSRIPVREALRQLEGEGLVVFRPYSGARVASLDLAACEELYKMRERLEPLALSESMRHLDDAQIAALRALAAGLEGSTDDADRWIAADRSFHLACYAGIRTPRLLSIIQGFWNASQPFRRVLVRAFDDADYGIVGSEHALIIDAIERRHERLGEDLMRAHIERSRMRLAALSSDGQGFAAKI